MTRGQPNPPSNVADNALADDACTQFNAQLMQLMATYDDPATLPEVREQCDTAFTEMVADLRRQANALCGADVVSAIVDGGSVRRWPDDKHPWQIHLLVGVMLMIEARDALRAMTLEPRTLH